MQPETTHNKLVLPSNSRDKKRKDHGQKQKQAKILVLFSSIDATQQDKPYELLRAVWNVLTYRHFHRIQRNACLP